ncbi:hypothetical protein OS21_40410 [Dickeya oryzae]
MMRKIRLVAALSCSLLAACQAPVSSLSDADLRQSAERGNGEAQYRLAKQLASHSHYVEAMQWMQKSRRLDGCLRCQQRHPRRSSITGG